ncbi:MAG: hypothetical protein AMS18_16475 [Gemmatimonas sp. SG8_17]|nr:MAG: hypothetical protein AMS18_16475 [Gemmatimonas sp. SG8_17]
MKLSVFLVINSIIAAVFGLGFVLMPGQVLSFYGVAGDAPLEYTGQLFGAALVSFAVLTWCVRNVPDSEARRAILLALLVGDAVGVVVSLIAQLGGVVSAAGWSTVAIYLLLAIGLAYFRFAAGSESSKEHGPVM